MAQSSTIWTSICAAVCLSVLSSAAWGGDQAALAGPYEDPLQQEIPFGLSSYYLNPWRAYMDTWPADQLLGIFGTTANGVRAEEAEAFAQVLAECGIRTCRVEIGWGSLDYDDPTRLLPERERHALAVLGALSRRGVRPLVLLNAHHGVPCPVKRPNVVLTADAVEGARSIAVRVEDLPAIRPGYTGLVGQAKANAFPLILEVGKDGVCTLSAPLQKPLKAGKQALMMLRFRPFSGAVLADGTPNPYAQETLDGWASYVRAIGATATKAAGPGGFDLEVWNEYTFGSNFLEEKRYYDPPRELREPVTYSNHGLTRKGHEIILPLTIDIAAKEFPGTGVISGFSNQRPWENGSEMWPGQLGFSRHYYTGANPGDWTGNSGLLSPRTETERNLARPVLDALGRPEGGAKPAAGGRFIPTLRVQMPEFNHFGYKTEFQTRDCQPFPGPWRLHHRYSHSGTGRPARLYMTEYNFYRWPFIKHVMEETGVAKDDPRLHALSLAVGAKALLRGFVFHSHKGWDTIAAFTAKAGDLEFALVPERFWTVLKEDNYQLTDRARAELGSQMAMIKRLSGYFAAGKHLVSTRHLSLDRLVEHEPRLVFKGDGTPAHPDRWNRDDFACLPYQFNATTFVVGYYVVTRDILTEYDKDRDPLDPARYAMAPQTFDMTLGNVNGASTVSAWDPLTDTSVPVEVIGRQATSLSVRAETVDYPRFLRIEEPQPGPLILSPLLSQGKLTFATNLPASPVVTWGAIPDRTDGGRLELAEGTTHAAKLPPLAPNCGVRIHLTVAGLTTSWPRWGHDVAGVLTWAKPDQAAPVYNFHVPVLPSVPAPVAFAGDMEDGARQEIQGVKVAVEHVTHRNPLDLLPALSVTDTVDIRRTMWGGTDAWQIHLRLDATAHPGLTDLEQYWWIAPYRSGLIALSCRGGRNPRGVGNNLSKTFQFTFPAQ